MQNRKMTGNKIISSWKQGNAEDCPVTRLFNIASLLGLAGLMLGCCLPGSVSARVVLGEPPAAPGWMEVPPPDLSPRARTMGGFEVDTAQREETRNFYNAIYKASENDAMNWSGDANTCTPGTIHPEFREATLLRINFFRALAGVPANIVFLETYNDKARQMALMMVANEDISHDPPASWLCYTEEGAEAANKSNLSLGSAGPEAVSNYIRDDGAYNAAVGHRRWLLYPQTREMGSADAKSSRYGEANVTWVRDGRYFNTRPATRNDFVAWPPAGYCPYQLLPSRWSLSYPDADFSQARVSMIRGNTSISVSIESRQERYGENTLVWRPELESMTAPSEDMSYQVEVGNVVVDGKTKDFTYHVTVFDPDLPGADTVLPTLSGPAEAEVNGDNHYSFDPVPQVGGHEWRRAELGQASPEGAENGTNGVEDGTDSSYDLITLQISANGDAAFHLAHPQAVAQYFTLKDEFLVGDQAELRFASRLGWSTGEEFAKVQVSLDGGQGWRDVYSQSGGNRESDFAIRRVSLEAYANRIIQLRFAYTLGTRGSYYSDTDIDVGWLVDDISLDNAWRLEAVHYHELDPDQNQLLFQPQHGGEYLLQVRALLYGEYPLDWAEPLRVTAVDTGLDPSRLPADRVFDWAEITYPALFQPAGASQRGLMAGYYYRYYAATGRYLGEKDGRIYYFVPAESPYIYDVGSLADYLAEAGSEGF